RILVLSTCGLYHRPESSDGRRGLSGRDVVSPRAHGSAAMGYRILLAGASGVIGRRLTPLLRDAGHHVAGTTRSARKAEELRRLGAEPVVVDVFAAASLLREVTAVRPEVVIHQLTDLPKGLDPSLMKEAIARN